jgi:hypothetical protein
MKYLILLIVLILTGCELVSPSSVSDNGDPNDPNNPKGINERILIIKRDSYYMSCNHTGKDVYHNGVFLREMFKGDTLIRPINRYDRLRVKWESSCSPSVIDTTFAIDLYQDTTIVNIDDIHR